jgi:hypothetical protein
MLGGRATPSSSFGSCGLYGVQRWHVPGNSRSPSEVLIFLLKSVDSSSNANNNSSKEGGGGGAATLIVEHSPHNIMVLNDSKVVHHLISGKYNQGTIEACVQCSTPYSSTLYRDGIDRD